MSGDDSTTGRTDTESLAGFANPLVAEFADGLIETVAEFVQLDAEESEPWVADFASDLLGDLDEKVSETLAARDEQIGKLTAVASDFKSGLLDIQGRYQRDKEALPANARARFAEAIFPVADAIEAAVDAVADADETVKSGIRGIGRQLETALESQGIVKIDALAKPLDIKFHEPIAETESSEDAAETVVAVARNGYVDRASGKVLRPTRVVIAKPSSEHGTEDAGD